MEFDVVLQLQTLIMSDSQQEPDGFRSRQNAIKRRIQQRNKIFAEFKNKKEVNQVQQPLPKYVGLSQTLTQQKKQESDAEQIDMFGDEILVKQRSQSHALQSTDQQGYYQVVNGKVVSKRYKVIDKIGRGVFGIVAKAVDQQAENREVALKILRNNQTTMLSGERQYKILSSMKKCDNIVGVFDYFHQDGHLFIVCQLMGPDLRTYTRKNQDKIALQHIKQYAISMFLSLHHLRKHKIIHADIKPDNFLLSLDCKSIKLADFGTAFSVDQHSTDVQYLVARYYRAPQVILGCQMPPEQRHGIDTWAVGCSLYQIFTGHFLFEGNSNNQMLKLMMQTRGKFNMKMLKKCKYYQKYFDSEFNFLYNYYDKNTKENTVKKMQITITQERQIFGLLKRYSRFDEDPKILNSFRDFLEGCLTLNPKNRLTPETALQHPFLNYQIKLN